MSSSHPAEYFNRAADNNKHAILGQIQARLSQHNTVLEIGSGTGQHAAFFAKACPQTRWQCSDQQANISAISYWQQFFALSPQPRPLNYQIGRDSWPCPCDAVYTANTAHIMSEAIAEKMYLAIGEHLKPSGAFYHYGPFKLAGKYSSDSNRDFDLMLRQQGYGGLRDIEQLKQWGLSVKLQLTEQINMPANNLLLIWQKQP
ncbi:DUF938 domain-containing protein [Agarivorans sp. MS3-6]